jgi:hypothetical protein
VGNEAGKGAPASGQSGQKSQSGGSGQPGSGPGHGQGAGQMPGGAGGRSQVGGGGHKDGTGDPGTDQTSEDTSKPSPPAQDADNPFGSNPDVAPRGIDQSNLTLRGFSDALKDALKDPNAAKELEEATHMSKAQLEQFARKYEKPNVAPGREAKDVELNVGEQPAAKPGTNLPNVTQRTSSTKIAGRGDMPRDTVRGNNEGNRLAPPRELQDRVHGYTRRLGKIQTGSGRAAPAKPASK